MRRVPKTPVLFRYLLSFIVILSLPIVFFGYLLEGRFLNILTDEIKQNDLSALSKTAAHADWMIGQFESIHQQVRLNQNMRPFLLFGNATSALNCVHELSIVKNANDVIYDLAIYYPRDGRLYTGAGSFSASLFSQTQVSFGPQEDAGLWKLLDEATTPVILPAREAALNGSANASFHGRVASFLYPINYYGTDSPDAALLFFVLEDSFFLGSSPEVKSVVLDETGRPLLHQSLGDPAEQTQFLANIPQGAASKEVVVAGTRYLCSQVVSAQTGWRFVSFTPMSHALAKTERLSREMTAYFFVIVALASVLIYLSMRLNYLPIKRLRDFAAAVGGVGRQGNELELVHSAMRSLSERNTRLIDSTSKASREYILRNLLKGRYTREEFETLTASFHLDFPHAYFVVLSVHLQDPAGGTLTKRIDELLGRSFVCYSVEGAAVCTAAVIVNCEGGERELIVDRLHEILRELDAPPGGGPSFGVGGIYGGIKDIPTSYMESLYALDYRFVKGNNSVTVSGETEVDDEVIRSYPYQDLERLKHLLRLGDVAATQELLGSILSYIKLSRIPLFVARRICFDIIGIITRSLSEMDLSPSGEKSWISLISRFETIDDLIEAVRNISSNICSAIKEQHAENVPLIDRLRAYAKENCLRPSFSIQEMADHFGMGVSHLSQYFKNKAGQTIMEYTIELRMSRARELIETGQYKQSEVAQRVGYTNQASFIRRFKQFYGQTPGQYAQAHLKGTP